MPNKRERNNRQKTLWSICIVIAVVIGARNVFATHLSEFCLSCGGFPAKGVSYDYYGYDGFPLQISQVLPNGEGVLATLHRDFMECDSWPRVIYIKMPTHGLVDDMPLPNCCYRCIGTFTYETVLGRGKTVSAFEPDEQRYQVICEQRAKLAREAAEEAARIKREQEEKQRALFEKNLEATAKVEVQEQESRKTYLRSQLCGFSLDPKSHFYVSRKCLSYVDISAADIRLKDERLKKMEACRDSEDWLGLFSNVAVMLQDGEVIRQILDRWHRRCEASDVENAKDALRTWRKTLASLCRAVEGTNEHCHSNYVLKVDAEIAKRWKNTADDSTANLQVYPPREVVDNVCDVFGALEYNVRLTLKGGDGTLKKLEKNEGYLIPHLCVAWCPVDSWAQFSNKKCQQYPFFIGETLLRDVCKVLFAPGNAHARIFVADYDVFCSINNRAKAKLHPILKKFNSYELEKGDAERQFNIARDEINKIIQSEFGPPAGSRDVSPLLKNNDAELTAILEDLGRFLHAVGSVKWPPEYLVVTNVSVVGGKMVYTEKKKNFKIPQKVRGLALLLDNKDVVKLYGKYCGGLDLGGFKEEWKNAGKKQENVYKKYKLAFESTERAMLKALEAANPKARSGFGQPMSLEDIANRQSNYSMPINQEQPRSSVGKTAKHVCDNCRGRKYVQTEVECPKCGGAGTTYTPAKKLIQGYSKPRTSQCSNCSGRGTVRKSVLCPNCNRD